MSSKVLIPTEHCGSGGRDSHTNDQHGQHYHKVLRRWTLGHISHCKTHSTPFFLSTPVSIIVSTKRSFSETFWGLKRILGRVFWCVLTDPSCGSLRTTLLIPPHILGGLSACPLWCACLVCYPHHQLGGGSPHSLFYGTCVLSSNRYNW